GDPDRASRLAADAEALARTITRPDGQAQALAELASAAARAGDPDRASRLATDGEALARTITDSHAQARALTELASAAARAGDPDRARRLLALALSAESGEIRSWVEGVSHFFPSAIRGAGDVFISAY